MHDDTTNDIHASDDLPSTSVLCSPSSHSGVGIPAHDPITFTVSSNYSSHHQVMWQLWSSKTMALPGHPLKEKGLYRRTNWLILISMIFLVWPSTSSVVKYSHRLTYVFYLLSAISRLKLDSCHWLMHSQLTLRTRTKSEVSKCLVSDKEFFFWRLA